MDYAEWVNFRDAIRQSIVSMERARQDFTHHDSIKDWSDGYIDGLREGLSVAARSYRMSEA